MRDYHLIFSILSAIILFLFGLSSFSSELKAAAGPKLQEIVNLITKNRFIAFFTGTIFTVIIQSSAAVTSLTVSLIDSGLLSFKGALAIILGAYIGTSLTALVVSLQISGIGPIFIVLGTLISLLPFKIKVLGKALFFFGFIFFSLDLVSNSLSPLKQSPELAHLLLQTTNPYMGFLIGAALTVLLQSSTVVTGLTIIFVQQGLIAPADSIPIVLGANVGTTGTALFASIKMNLTAKKAALSNTIINLIGAVIVFIFLTPFTDFVLKNTPDMDMVVAFAHLTFNIMLTLIFMVFLTPFVKLMDRMVKDD